MDNISDWLGGARSVEEHRLANELAYDPMHEDDRRRLAGADQYLCGLALARAKTYDPQYWDADIIRVLESVLIEEAK